MSKAAALPGADCFQKSELFLKKALVWGSCAAGGNFVQKKTYFFFEQATCPGQLRCLGQFFSQKSDLSLNKALVRGSCAAWGRTVPQNSDFFEDTTCLGQLRCLGQFFSQKSVFFEESTCLGQLRCLVQNFYSEISIFRKKPLVRGSCAAWGRTFSQKSVF